ncbi:MAG: dihydropteroate synthase, partial [Magnetococcus sp. YQC-5]
MTLHVLMEPLTGVAFHTRKRSTVLNANLHPEDPDSLWAIRVTEWHTTRDDLLPAGMHIVTTAQQRQIAGQMSGARITAWVDQLATAGLDPIAKAVTETMAAHLAPPPVWNWGSQHQWRLDFSRPLIMGILNVTVDSFSGDGLAGDLDAVVTRGLAMSAAGADILDVGGESTRPGAMPVTTEIELQRVVPVIQALSKHVTLPISVDTSKPEVMTAALDAGAALINDVTALRGPESQQTARMLAERRIPAILMHMQQTPLTMQQAPVY